MPKKKKEQRQAQAAAVAAAANRFREYQGDEGSSILPLFAWDFDLLIKALEALDWSSILPDSHINTPNGFLRRDHLVRWLKENKRYFTSPCHEEVMADLRMRVWKEKVNYSE